MSRIAIPARDNVPEASTPILDAIEKQFGVVPNLFRLLALSPAALSGFVALNSANAKALDVRTRARIAIAVAQVNGCDYCLSAHTYLALNLAKLAPEDAALARQGRSVDHQAGVAVRFARLVAEKRGRVSDAELNAVRVAGYSDAQVVEIVALVAENVLTNFLNTVAETDIDFPVVSTAA
jgi:uncharacterized peroxidase-related enzyme